MDEANERLPLSPGTTSDPAQQGRRATPPPTSVIPTETTLSDTTLEASNDAQLRESARESAQQSQRAQPISSTFGAIMEAFMNSFRNAASSGQVEQPLPRSRPPGQNEAGQQGFGERSSPVSIPIPSASEVQSGGEQSGGAQLGIDTGATRNAAPLPSADGTDHSRSAPTLLFQMPFLTQSGRPATLAFVPGPLPLSPQQQQQRQQQQQQQQHARQGSLSEDSPERGNSQYNGFHVPTAPIFVPMGSSPLPFSFLFDNQINTAWPIVALPDGGQPMPPGAMPHTPHGVPRTMPEFMAGPPFHVVIDFNFVPAAQPERPDPARAGRFVSSLERADAELRARMARLGMGDIGSHDSASDHPGCPICLDEYEAEDVPEWMGGQASKDQEVVAVPCAGHHTLHHRCLLEWLANNAPSQWTCPLCRAALDREKVDSSAADSQQANATDARRPEGQRRADEELKKAEHASKARTLREEVRLRERSKGWRCDSPACLPRYPDDESSDLAGTSISTDYDLVSLLPCRHKLHLDCLCTSMRLEQAVTVSSEDEDEDEGEDDGNLCGACRNDEEDDDQKSPSVFEGRSVPDLKGNKISIASSKADAKTVTEVDTSTITHDDGDGALHETVGKWVTCPACRIEAWAELPVKRKSRRIKAAHAKQQEQQQEQQKANMIDNFTMNTVSGNYQPANKEVELDQEPRNDSGVSLQHTGSGAVTGIKRPLSLDAAVPRERARLNVDQEAEYANDSDFDVEAMLR